MDIKNPQLEVIEASNWGFVYLINKGSIIFGVGD